MLLHLVDIGGAQFRGFSGGTLSHSLVTAGYAAIGIIAIVFGYSHQQPTLRMAGIAVLCVGGLVAWLAALKRYSACSRYLMV